MGPNRNAQKMRAVWETSQGRRIQQGLKGSHSEMEPIICPAQSIIDIAASIPSEHKKHAAYCPSHISPATAVKVFSLCALLFFARYAYAAEQEKPDLNQYKCEFVPYLDGCEHRPLFQCNGCVHQAAGYVDKAVQFADEHQTALTAASLGLHTGVGLLLGGPTGAAAADLEWAVDQVKSKLAHQALGPAIDQLVQLAAETIAPAITKYDPQATEEDAIKVASAIAVGAIESYDLDNFVRNFKTYDFSRAKIGKALHQLSKPESGSNFAPEFAKILTERIPGEVADSFARQAFAQEMKESAAKIKEQLDAASKPLSIPQMDKMAGNAYEALEKNLAQVAWQAEKLQVPEALSVPLATNGGQFLSTVQMPAIPETFIGNVQNNFGQTVQPLKIPIEFVGTHLEPLASNFGPYSGTVLEPYAKNFDQVSRTGSLPAGVGTVFQSLNENRNYYFSTGNQKKGY